MARKLYGESTQIKSATTAVGSKVPRACTRGLVTKAAVEARGNSERPYNTEPEVGEGSKKKKKRKESESYNRSRDEGKESPSGEIVRVATAGGAFWRGMHRGIHGYRETRERSAGMVETSFGSSHAPRLGTKGRGKG